MAPVILAEFVLPIDIDTFYDTFWMDNYWYERFLADKLLDLSVNVGEWTSISHSQTRNVRSFHPSKISFPGLPSHAESHKLQTIETFHSDKEKKVLVKEVNSFRGIPYSDYFNVNTEWIVTSYTETSGNKSSDSTSCYVAIHLDFTFHKSTWLQGTIESNTKAELVGVFELWREAAEVTIKLLKEREKQTKAQQHQQNQQQVPSHTSVTPSESMMDFNNEQLSVATDGRSAGSMVSRSRSRSRSEDGDYPPFSSGYGSDEDDMFYDCEEGSGQQLLKSSRSNRSISADPSMSLHFFKAEDSSAPPNNHYTGVTMAIPHSPKGGSDGEFGQQNSARDLAVSIVETLFVLAEFSFWKVHTVYMYDLKELFKVEPKQVFSRILNSFLPGWHSPILLHPDLYGPLLAVFTLPQSLLISMETSKHGCNPTSQLGNAVVVSVFIWIGLSCLYRLLSLLIAPTIGLKHCLSMTGYSFFSWNLALLCSFPLELYGDYLRIPMMLPLVVLGIPSSLALGSMFWEQTPASTITLQPASLPTSMQQFATNNSRWLQRVLWAFPKILAFILVTGTHYQFLWYMARVFLPGRKQLCQLSALVQPSQYADILTQKELRKFAIMLLLGKKDD